MSYLLEIYTKHYYNESEKGPIFPHGKQTMNNPFQFKEDRQEIVVARNI